MGKYIKIGGSIGNDSMSNYDSSMRRLVMDFHSEDSEHMKDVDDNIIGKLRENQLKWKWIMMMMTT